MKQATASQIGFRPVRELDGWQSKRIFGDTPCFAQPEEFGRQTKGRSHGHSGLEVGFRGVRFRL